MDAIISLIFWGVIISRIVKAVKRKNEKEAKQRNAKQQRPVQRTTQAQRDAYYYNQQRNTKERLQQKYGTQQKAAPKQDIFAKAKQNVKEETPNVMQQQMHVEVCRDYRATANSMTDVKLHKELASECDAREESDIIKSVNDLIVTGYSGGMTFDRDFIAEGVDMLNRFSL